MAGRIRALIVSLFLAAAAAMATEIDGRVVDENGAPVQGARITVEPGGTVATADAAGLFHFEVPAAGAYQVTAQHEGFFLFANAALNLDVDTPLEIHMNHLKELAESVDVRYSPPAIDPGQTSDTKQLQSPDILNVPFPASQDYRSALPLMSGAIQDAGGQVHFNGGDTTETNYRLNGFDVADPATGNLTTRVNVDTVQSIEWDASRFSPEKGKGSAGTLDINTQMGDDHWRFGGTNFIPGIGAQDGVYINHWSPRLTLSGPIRKKRAWFHNAFDTYYTANTISGLPSGQNRTTSYTGSNLTRVQWNIRDWQILTASFLVNYADSKRNGLSFLNPAETTVNQRQTLFIGTVKDRFLVGGGLIEAGFASTSAFLRISPQGDQPYVITPFGATGNYFRDQTTRSQRQEWLVNGYVKPIAWHGSHQIQAGSNVERSEITQDILRHDLTVVRADNSVVRTIEFEGSPQQFRTNVEVYGYALDRWSPFPDVTVEAGLRTQWDEYTHGAPPAPRFAATWAPKRLGGTKFSAGWGIFYNAVTLGMLTLSQEQTSVSTFYSPTGAQVGVPLQSSFLLRPQDLRLPRFAISSFAVEQKLPWSVYGKANLISREGSRGFSFVEMNTDPAANQYVLANIARERYRAAEITLRRTFLAKYQWFASYTRSEARSSAAIAYSIENPILTPQTGGPLGWDAPNRFLMWGWAPVEKHWFPHLLAPLVEDTDIQMLADYHTGLPFTATTELGYIAGQPNQYRYPDYFTLNLALERRFPFRGNIWAFRAGLINVLDRQNPNVVNSDFNSPQFLVYGRGQARAVNVRLRFIGKK